MPRPVKQFSPNGAQLNCRKSFAEYPRGGPILIYGPLKSYLCAKLCVSDLRKIIINICDGREFIYEWRECHEIWYVLTKYSL